MDWIWLFVQGWLKLLYKEHFIDQAVKFTLALSQDLKVTMYVTWDCSMLSFDVIPNWRRSFVFLNVLIEVSARIPDIVCITQTTFVVVNNALLVNDRWLLFFWFDITLIKKIVWSPIRLLCNLCMYAEKKNWKKYIIMFYFYKLKQLKEVLYDGLEKMPRKDGKTHRLIIFAYS